MTAHKGEKIQKVLANCALGSRREIEKWLQAGRIKVNHQVATLGDRMLNSDHVTVDDKPITLSKSDAMTTEVLCYNKPLGQVCTRSDEKHRPTVFDTLPTISQGRWIMVGRLDINTSGLLLFTNNGELAHQLMHPSNGVMREYDVDVAGHVTPNIINRLKTGVMLEDGMAALEEVNLLKKQWYRVALAEGRNREVRRLFSSQGLNVVRLVRVAYGIVRLPARLGLGQYQRLDRATIKTLSHLIRAKKVSP